MPNSPCAPRGCARKPVTTSSKMKHVPCALGERRAARAGTRPAGSRAAGSAPARRRSAASSSRALLQDLQRLGRAVVEHEHVLRRVDGMMPGAAGMLLQLARAADDHLVEDAVVGAGEDRDEAPAGDGAGDAHRAHHRLRAGVAERRAVGAGDLAEQRAPPRRRGRAAGRSRSRASTWRGSLAEEVRLPAEQAHAEAAQDVDVLVAVEVPHPAAARSLDHDLVGELLGERPEAVDDARVGHERAMLGGVGLRPSRCARCSAR